MGKSIEIDKQGKWHHKFNKSATVWFMGELVTVDRKFVDRIKRPFTGEIETIYCVSDNDKLSTAIPQEEWEKLDITEIFVNWDF